MSIGLTVLSQRLQERRPVPCAGSGLVQRRVADAASLAVDHSLDMVRLARTENQDAVPMTVGQEMHAFAATLEDDNASPSFVGRLAFSPRAGWEAGVSAHHGAYNVFEADGLAVDERGFVLVDERLRSVSHPEVFAAGDCATLRHAPHSKSGVYAVRHAPVLAANLGGAERRYVPQRRALALIGCGDRHAIADWNGLSVEGAWVWRWKDRIDRRWVEGFR